MPALEIEGLTPFLQVETASSFGNWLDEHPFLAQLIGLAGLVVVAVLALMLVRRLALPLLTRLIKRSRFTWDDAFLDARFFRQLSRLVPLLVMWSGVDLLERHFHLDPTAHGVIQNVAAAALVLCGLLAAGAFLNALHSIYARRPGAVHRPVKGYVELAKIFLYVVGGLVAIAALLGKDVGAIVAGIGAMTAVLLLIFKDTILSAVASVQLTNQDMVRIGDWIEMPSVGADGDVIDIALHTVKVQNWDKTVSTIPTYRLVSDTFKNWRGMQETGGRRIKRSLNIDLSTVRFLDKREVDKFGKIDVLAEYIAGKKEQLAASNQEQGKGAPRANLRRLTNIGTFRAYLIHYLRQHPRVHDGLTFLVRQLQPTEHGLPVEVYLFTDTTAWGEYESIQADIFDHLLAVMPEFGLRVYQRPSGADLAEALTAPE